MGDENEGIAVFELDMHSGQLTHRQAVRGLRNPTFLALHPSLPVLYASERETTAWGPFETMAGLMTSLTIGSDGELTLLVVRLRGRSQPRQHSSQREPPVYHYAVEWVCGGLSHRGGRASRAAERAGAACRSGRQ